MTQAHEQYDAIIIGVGQAGNPLATALSQAGWKTAVIERRFVGGTCVNDGCTPTKTMIASGRVAYLARRAGDYGVYAGSVTVNLAEVRRRKQAIVETDRAAVSTVASVVLDDVDLIYGEAEFDGPKSLTVTTEDEGMRHLSAGTIFINTGARPAKPEIPGLDTTPSFNSTTIMELDVVPDHLLILGGGYIGLEFAQLFRRLGSRVTILQRSAQLIPREDADVAEALTAILREDGIDVLVATTTVRTAATPGDGVVLTVRDARGERQLGGQPPAGGHGTHAEHRASQPPCDRRHMRRQGIYPG